MELKDKVVVITGAARGFGAELAKSFYREGSQLVLSDLNSATLASTASPLGALSIAADVRSESAVNNLATTAVANFGWIDLWINNAGVWLPHARVEDFAMDAVQNMFAVNVFGVMHGCRAALSVMRPRGYGAILNVISLSALEAHLDSAFYGASKRAADGFTKGLRLEMEKYEAGRIQIFSVYPGGMKTALFAAHPPAHYESYADPASVAATVIANLKRDHPEIEQVIK